MTGPLALPSTAFSRPSPSQRSAAAGWARKMAGPSALETSTGEATKFCEKPRKKNMANHPIFAPTFHGDVTRVKELLDADPSLISMRDAKNLTPLHVAASRGHADVIRLLLDRGADINGPTAADEWTPIVFAAYRGHLDAVRVLIENDADITETGGNPIHFAGQRRHKEICRLLVESGAIDELIDPKNDQQLQLFRAAYSYDSESVERVLATCPDLVNSTDRKGRTPMHEACIHGDTKTVRVLLKLGAKADIKDDNQQTPSDRAVAHRQHSVTKLLAKHAAKI